MALIPLTNERWGFSSNCFVCEPTNDHGLRLASFHDDERDVVTCTFSLDQSFSGTPAYLHGGVVQAILDEVQAWAAIAVAGKFALTRSTTVEFLRPVRVDREYRAEAEVTTAGDETIETVGRIIDHNERVCTEAVASFSVISAALAADAVGELTEDETAYLRE